MKHEDFTATTNGLLTSEGFLRFALWFAQSDLSSLRAGTLVNLREDFETFLARKGWVSIVVSPGACILATPEIPPLPEDFTLEDFQKLQHAVFSALRHEASQRESRWMLTDLVQAVHPHGFQKETPGRKQIVVHGTAEQCFLAILEWLLIQEPPDRIKSCPECGRLFYRIKQQAYCARACGNRLAVRNWRARQDTPATASP